MAGQPNRLAACVAVTLLVASGCFAFVPEPEGSWSFGHTSDGAIVRGARLPDEGDGFIRARPGEDTRFGTPRLVGALERAVASVAGSFPGSAPMRIGDLSAPGGGRHTRHNSHRSGRDADVIFFVTDAMGRSVRGRGWLAFDRFGAARETDAPEGLAPSNELFFFDDARNWHFVRTLVLDDEAEVQWIFCSRGIKARLLAYAMANEPDPRAVFRASWVLHQPTRGHPHHDHFHVRVQCTAEERTNGCYGFEPIWPWQRDGVEKPPDEIVPAALDEAALLDALTSDDEPE